MALWLIPLLAVLLYLFLIAPNHPRRVLEAFPQRYFAHRGLHDPDAPENSLSAFRRAVAWGCGIELDVRLTGDGCIIVHHDDSALRMCGADRAISEMTLDEASALRLMGTQERIPSLKDVCALVNGSVPLLIEMKSGRGSRALPGLLFDQMADYPGRWYVESFDPRMLWWFRRHAPQVLRGQLAYDPCRAGGGERGILYRLGAHMMMNFLSRPDFIAYGWEGDKNLSFRIVRRVFQPPAAAWTVRSATDSRRLEKTYDLQIFEGFCPDSLKTNQEREKPE